MIQLFYYHANIKILFPLAYINYEKETHLASETTQLTAPTT